jgi:hypothetical protein
MVYPIPRPMYSWVTTPPAGATNTAGPTEYLRGVTEGIEALFDAPSQLVRRPFKGRELDEPVCTALRGR